MKRQQSMRKCAAIKRPLPLGECRKVERMGRTIHEAEAEWKRSPEFAAQWARPREQGRCHEQRYRGSSSSDLESGR